MGPRWARRNPGRPARPGCDHTPAGRLGIRNRRGVSSRRKDGGVGVASPRGIGGKATLAQRGSMHRATAIIRPRAVWGQSAQRSVAGRKRWADVLAPVVIHAIFAPLRPGPTGRTRAR